MIDLLNLLTALGDSRLLLGAATMVIAACRARREAVAGRWLLSLLAVCSITLGSKLAFLGWGVGIAALDFTGFSGHAAVSAATWPVLLAISGGLRRGWLLAALVCIGLALAATIAWSRVELTAHSPSEVVTGWMLGTFAALYAVGGTGTRVRLWAAPAAALAMSALALALLPVPSTHEIVIRAALLLSGSSHVQTRDELHGANRIVADYAL